ncbi:MAG TPA: hypothetical protein VLG69_01995, partial [Candidatus Andersenbacteria bacterium]|nr:hypothetical protein [Candidatus Andersenbacteria bacterium]
MSAIFICFFIKNAMLFIKYESGPSIGKVEECPEINPDRFLASLITQGINWKLDYSEAVEGDKKRLYEWHHADIFARMSRAYTAQGKWIEILFQNQGGYEAFGLISDPEFIPRDAEWESVLQSKRALVLSFCKQSNQEPISSNSTNLS